MKKELFEIEYDEHKTTLSRLIISIDNAEGVKHVKVKI